MVWKREGGATREQQLAERGTLSPKGVRRSVDDANARLLRGGGACSMKSLQNELRDAEASFRSAGCS